MFSTRSLTSASLLCGLGLFTTLVIMTAAVPSLQPTTAASTQMPSIQDADPLTIWKERLAAESPGSWIASNADYSAEDGGTDLYGLDWQVLPGGVASRGCLWGENNGVVTVHWQFSQLWDPVENRGILYQSSPYGAIAIGPSYPERDGIDGMMQTLVQPDGSRMEMRHTSEHAGPDVRLDHSFDRPIGGTEWIERRSYRWVRSLDHPSPCG